MAASDSLGTYSIGKFGKAKFGNEYSILVNILDPEYNLINTSVIGILINTEVNNILIETKIKGILLSNGNI